MKKSGVKKWRIQGLLGLISLFALILWYFVMPVDGDDDPKDFDGPWNVPCEAVLDWHVPGSDDICPATLAEEDELETHSWRVSQRGDWAWILPGNKNPQWRKINCSGWDIFTNKEQEWLYLKKQY